MTRSQTQGSARRWLTAVVLFLWHLPRNTLIIVLKLYRRVVSPIYGQVCRFFPSCSAYALEAVTVHGAVKGSFFAARRVVRCHPWSAGGLDPVPSPAHVDWEDPLTVPLIVQLNHPDVFLAKQQETQSRDAA
ncbi:MULTISPECIES: membrane protein insertion efficiency factor YidD [Arthrobacter]|uniref:membrane protein insertion efficiency factor YidD n=1 Tax=unclassified Arthrobacter TaxID=235627 RepID=UPI0024BAE67A|nr:membrane protein insertion efficiency factor YidD [Arthrobacter sp. H35-MC1]MDJ0316576.1 membrane protein insertion efficiency factor YidD [Arthrobacter sp. H35-MC1]